MDYGSSYKYGIPKIRHTTPQRPSNCGARATRTMVCLNKVDSPGPISSRRSLEGSYVSCNNYYSWGFLEPNYPPIK